MLFATTDTANNHSRETFTGAVVSPEPRMEPDGERKLRPVVVTGASGFVGGEL